MAFVTLVHGKPKFSDQQIAAMTPQYFKRNHSAPKLTGLKIYTDNGQRVYQVEIRVSRNRSNDDLSFAVSALANMGQYAKKPFKKYVVVMHSDVRGKTVDAVNSEIYREISTRKISIPYPTMNVHVSKDPT